MPQPPPLTDRQELFCRHVARGASGAAAARWAGYATDSAAKQASVMLDRPHIRSRIEDLKVKREIARQTGIAEMVDRLRALAKLSIAKGDYRTVMRSIEFEARLTGLIPEKHAATPFGGFAGSDPLLDGIDPRTPSYAAACAEAWVDEWRSGLEPEPQEKPEPVIVPHVWEGFEGRPLDDFTPDTDLERAGLPPRDALEKGTKGKEKEGFTAADLAAFEAEFGKEEEEEGERQHRHCEERPSSRRHCEERSDEATHMWTAPGLQVGRADFRIGSLASICPACGCDRT